MSVLMDGLLGMYTIGWQYTKPLIHISSNKIWIILLQNLLTILEFQRDVS